MKLVIETWADFFSDEVEDMLFGIGKYATLPPLYTYVPSTKEVVDCSGVAIDKVKTKKEFFEKYPKGVVWKL
jgi:hypothetical protein